MTPAARIAALAAGSAWLGSVAGWALGIDGAVLAVVLVLPVVVLVGVRRLPSTALVVCVVAIGASISGHLAAAREAATLDAPVPTGRIQLTGVVADEPVHVRDEVWVVVDHGRTPSTGALLPPIVVVWTGAPYPEPGDRVGVVGRLAEFRRHVRDDPVAGRVTANRSSILERAPGSLHRVASALRRRVVAVLHTDESGSADALLAGFLIGDTSRLSSTEVDELRAAGLSHFVAVSGSNVALFLAAWWLVLAPLAGPRVRAGLGLIGVVLFSLVTRWEPSVLRAATMIGVVLVGRLAGVPIDPIVALGWGVTILLLFAGQLAGSVGFQLSVAATIGVMAGARVVGKRRPRMVWSILGATAGAQVAVAPIALAHFGTIPLMAPLANLIAAPIVTAATAVGGAAVLVGGRGLLSLARIPADAVLWIAAQFADWPQLDGIALTGVLIVGACVRYKRTRAAAVVASAVGVLIAMMPAPVLPGASLVALDVGQGDAVLVRDGQTMLVDGGRDPEVLGDALAHHDVSRIDLLVVTHGDADHAGGLLGITDKVTVGELWVPAFGDLGELVEQLVVECRGRGIPVAEIATGAARLIGRVAVSTLGPQRRYKSDNDGSIVLWLEVGGTSVLLPGDIEAVAQRELPQLRPDVLVVPHHGAATTDLVWLAEVTGPLAIVSVGPNRYGHPRAEVLDTLEAAGARILSTATGGDIVVALP